MLIFHLASKLVNRVIRYQFAKWPRRYGNSHATWDHAPGRGDIPAFTAAKLVLDLATPKGCKAELTVTYLLTD